MKKLILALLFGLLAVPALQAAQLPHQEEIKVAAEQSPDSNEKESCVICLEPLTNPINQPWPNCLHNKKVDIACFDAYAVSKMRQNENVPCPLCRKIVIQREEPAAAVLLGREDLMGIQNGDDLERWLEEIRIMHNQEQVAYRRKNFELCLPASLLFSPIGLLLLVCAKKLPTELPGSYREKIGIAACGIILSTFGAGLGYATYLNCPPEISAKVQRTKAFIARHKNEIGVLTVLASLGWLGNKMLALTK